MKSKILIRIAAGCLLFFAVGHSIGHFTRHIVTDIKAQMVLRQMIENKFDMFGQMRSYDENYTGMSLNLIVTLITIISILWVVSSKSESQPKFVRNILIPVALCTLGFRITSFLYFFKLPAITCSLALLLMIFAIIQLSNKRENV